MMADAPRNARDAHRVPRGHSRELDARELQPGELRERPAVPRHDWHVTYADRGRRLDLHVGRLHRARRIASRDRVQRRGARRARCGLRFLASDTGAFQYWNGAAWVRSAQPRRAWPGGGDLAGTYPNPPVNTVAISRRHPDRRISRGHHFTVNSGDLHQNRNRDRRSRHRCDQRHRVRRGPPRLPATVTILGVPVVPIRAIIRLRSWLNPASPA